MRLGDRAERLVREAENALRADVEPPRRGHLPVHGQAGVLEPPERVLVRPGRHDHPRRDEDTRRVRVRREDGYRLPGLDDQRLVRAEALERRHDPGERLVAPRGTAAAAVDDQGARVLGDVWVEVVEEAAKRPLLLPAATPQLAPPRSAAEKTVEHGRIVFGARRARSAETQTRTALDWTLPTPYRLGRKALGEQRPCGRKERL